MTARRFGGAGLRRGVRSSARLGADPTLLGITGLWAWYRGDSFVDDGAGGIQEATDLSGNARHATQTTASRRPGQDSAHASWPAGAAVFTLTQVNGFDLPSLSALTSAEMFSVIRHDASPPAGNGIWSRIGTPGDESHVPFTDLEIYDAAFSTVRKSAGTIGITITSPFAYCVSSQSGEWTCRVNGVQQFTTATNTFGTTTAVLGANAGYTLGLTGEIADVAIFDHVLTTEERDSVESYINARPYGLSI